ncbi:MAG: hypothetical protein M1831_003080 [Alyxoria varia]|nr:MAG: hypothetical protein M1831_003080 [Alyxoria varia]
MVQEIVLVVGGCGFIGYHIVKQVQQEHRYWNIHVMSRDPTRNQISGVEYHAASISSYEDVSDILQRISPTIIIHSASPPMVGDYADKRSCLRTNIEGTRCLLDCAVATHKVKAFIFTSSTMILQGASHHMTDENAPLRSWKSKGDAYPKSKAIADKMVLGRNHKSGMLTCCLRLPATYGEFDQQNIGEGLRALFRREHKIQVGNNTNLFDFLSAENAARAHVLALDALVEERIHSTSDDCVAGQAFNITDGHPLPFWNFWRLLWRATGDMTPESMITVIPPWLMMIVAGIVEFAYWVCTFATKRPKALRRDLLELTYVERTFSIEKARARLAYEPLDNRDSQIQAGVDCIRLETFASTIFALCVPKQSEGGSLVDPM